MENFYQSLIRAKDILKKNQYPPEFYDQIISTTIDKLKGSVMPEADPPTNTNEPSAPKHLYRIQYRGRVTDSYVKRLRAADAPIQPVITLRKLRLFLPSLKEPVPKELTNLLIFKIQCPSCPACYVGWTNRHLTTRFGEHCTRTRCD